jgi:hypothetical protein
VVETSNFQMGQQVVINEPVIPYNPLTSNRNPENASLNFTIYPNPGHDILVVQSSVSLRESQVVKIMDLGGKVLFTETMNQGSTMCYFDTQTLYQGIYLICIEGKTGRKFSKFIIEN